MKCSVFRIKYIFYVTLSILFFILNASLTYAQQKVSGRVIDSVTGESLAFVNISAGGSYGTTTNIDGLFSFEIPETTTSLRFSFIGYEPLIFPINQSFNYPTLTVYLNPSSLYLSEVIVDGTKVEDSAKEIIREVIKNKEKHRPESLPFFSFNAYRKIILNPIFTNPDAFRNLQESYKKRYMGVMETASELYYEPETGFREEIGAVQASGLKEPRFAMLTNQLPFFSFYQESFELLEKSFYSPIANGALRKYDYQLTDTLFNGPDSVFVVAYQPKKGRKFDGLKGLLYINNNGYALQNVIAEPSDKEFAEMRLEQQYNRVGDRWFPEQILYRIHLPEYPSKELGLSVESRTYVSEVLFEEPVEKPKWGSTTVKVKPKAYNRDSLDWLELRAKPLDSLEQFTYQYMDSVAKSSGIRFFEKLFNSSLDGLYDTGPFSFRIGDFIQYNEHEGLRPGIGIQTNSKVSTRFSLGGYIGIGLRDESVKYAVDFSTLLLPSQDMRLKVAYQKSVQEPGIVGSSAANFLQSGYSRRLMTARMNETKTWLGNLSFRPFKRIISQVEFQQADVQPLFEYQFQPELITTFTDYQLTQASLRLAFTANDDLLFRDASQQTSVIQQTPPILSFYFDKGEVSSGTNNNISYERYQVILNKTFKVKGGTHFSLRFEGGLVNGEVPYPLLFNGTGSKANDYEWIDAANTFRTMGIYEFMHDRFANVFLSLGTGRPLFKFGIFQPEPVIIHGSTWGELSNPEAHLNIDFLQAKKGYHETGLQLHNILGLGYINIARLGIGGGIYYRHGEYSFDDTSDNLSYKLLMKFYF